MVDRQLTKGTNAREQPWPKNVFSVPFQRTAQLTVKAKLEGTGHHAICANTMTCNGEGQD